MDIFSIMDHCLLGIGYLDNIYNKMRFALTLETDLFKSQSLTIVDLSNLIEEYFYGKNYGKDVIYILIGVIALDTTFFEDVFKVRKPKYVDFKIIKDGIGNPVEISKHLAWDIKPDYEAIKNLEGIALQSIVAQAVLASIKELKLPKKVQNFDLKTFEKDIETFFRQKGLI